MATPTYEIAPTRLTDGSNVYDVIAFDGVGANARFYCADQAAAESLKAMLENSSVVIGLTIWA